MTAAPEGGALRDVPGDDAERAVVAPATASPLRLTAGHGAVVVIVAVQVILIAILGLGIVNGLRGLMAGGAPDGTALRGFIDTVAEVLLIAGAVGVVRNNSRVAAVTLVATEVVAGCLCAVDALAGLTGTSRLYLAAWAVGAVAVTTVVMPRIDTERPSPRPAAADGFLIRAGLRDFLDLQRRDVAAILGLTLLAFVIRFASPIFIHSLDNVRAWPPVTAMGVGHPYNGGECADIPVAGPTHGSSASPVGGGATQTTVQAVHRCGFVFDEVYFPVDASKDLHQPAVTYFDPEPPLTKLLMTPALHFLGFNTWSWRITSAVFGSLLAGLMYMIALRLRRDRFFALVAGAAVCFDGLALVESRVGIIDIIAIFWVALLYYVFLLHWQARTRTQWRVTLYVMAAVMGLAFAAKLTALAPTVLIIGLVVARNIEISRPVTVWLWLIIAMVAGLVAGVLVMHTRTAVNIALVIAIIGATVAMPAGERLVGSVWPWLHSTRSRRDAGPELWRQARGPIPWAHWSAAIFLVFVVFCFSWSRYLTVPQSYYVFTSCDAKTTGLVGSTLTDTPPLMHINGITIVNPVGALRNIYDNMHAGIVYHTLECHGHPYSSMWFTWPVMEHPVLMYYASDTPDPLTGAGGEPAAITNMGNPGIWWPGLFAVLFCAWRMLGGPLWWRVGVSAVGAASLAALMIVFAMGSKPQDVTVRVTLDWRYDVALAGMALFGLAAVVSAVFSRRFVPAFIVGGYELAWLMWVPGNADRVLFFYHALGMFLLMALAYAYMLTAIRNAPWVVRGRALTWAPITYGLLGVALAGFVFFYPVWTAIPQPAADHGMRLWVDTW